MCQSTKWQAVRSRKCTRTLDVPHNKNEVVGQEQSTFCGYIVRCDGGKVAPCTGTPCEVQGSPKHAKLDFPQHENEVVPDFTPSEWLSVY